MCPFPVLVASLVLRGVGRHDVVWLLLAVLFAVGATSEQVLRLAVVNGGMNRNGG